MSLWAVALLFGIVGSAAAQKEGGVFTAGDIWESFLPSNASTRPYTEVADDPKKSYDLFRVGNWDRQWTTPTQTYPGGENIHLPWGQDIQMSMYSSGEINNFTDSNAPNAKNYLLGFYTNNLAGAGDANRDATNNRAATNAGGFLSHLSISICSLKRNKNNDRPNYVLKRPSTMQQKHLLLWGNNMTQIWCRRRPQIELLEARRK